MQRSLAKRKSTRSSNSSTGSARINSAALPDATTLRASSRRTQTRIPEENKSAAKANIRGAVLYALIFCATLIAYIPALNGRLLWDDDAHITTPAMQNLHGLWRIWFDLGATQQYYPLLHSPFWIEHRLWGDAALGYHLVNIALHALAACLVVAIVRRLALP